MNQDIINDFSVNLENVQISLFKNDKLPIIEIKQRNALKKAKYKINCTNEELESIDKLISEIK